MERYQIDTIAMIHKHGDMLDAFSDEQIAELYVEWSNKMARANWLSPRERTIARFYEWATTAPCDRRLPALPGEHVHVAGPHFKPKSLYLTTEGYPLGTECWYFYIEFNGLRKWCCGDTQNDAWQSVIEFLNSEYATIQRRSPDIDGRMVRSNIKVNPDIEKFTQRLQTEGSKTVVEFSVSSYDIPASISSYYDGGAQVIISFKYISDSNEPTVQQQHTNLITWILGKNSGRLYGIKIGVFKATRLKDVIYKSLEHLIEHPHNEERQDNYRLAKESLIEKADAIFGIETNG